MKASRKNPALAGLVIVSALVLLVVGLPFAISADAPTEPTFTVTDTSGAAVQYAKVYAIPSADVDALAAVPLTLQTTGNYTAEALAADEPLEDLINGNYTPAGGGVATYQYGVTDGTGTAQIPGIASSTDTYFIYVQPAVDDSQHLPGGSTSRMAVTGVSLDDKVTDVAVSTKPSDLATFVGSSSCLSCHTDKTDVSKTAHKNGFMNPGEPSGLQDLSEFDGDDGEYNAAAALQYKFTETGTTVYFYDYDGTRKFDKFKTSETNPDPTGTIGNVWATVKVWKDPADGQYKMTFTNVKNPADPASPFTEVVDLTYGGGVYKQRYLTAQGTSIHMLPLQYNSRGTESAGSRTAKVWRDYHMDWWINNPTTTPTFKAQPANNNAADIQCASCHFNGYTVTKDVNGVFSATGVADPNGEIHPVTGDHRELNIGCETCHGAGSEHVAVGGNGEFIVTPQNTTPERESAICSQCHSRPQGNDSLGIKKDGPLNADNKTMPAGTSRADFLANFTSRHDAASGDMWTDGLHSKSHHQQYTDFIQTSMYRNGSQLETCSSCHNNHGPGTDRHQLSGTSDDTLCKTCHASVDSSDHQIEKSGYDMGASCIECHNVKISSSGAGTNPTGTYPHGDISSHLFDVPTKAQVGSAKMPVPYTNTCGACHWPLSGAPAPEQPDLSINVQRAYWGSYADYVSRIVSVDFGLANGSPGIAGNAYNVSVVGTVNTQGVTSVNTPLAVGAIPAGLGSAKPAVIRYSVPAGASYFRTSVFATGEDGVHNSYAYPGPMPGA
ncbi:MAG: cytochrome c3 family protein [Pseudomonadota bacterium]